MLRLLRRSAPRASSRNRSAPSPGVSANSSPELEGRAVYAVGDVVTHNLLGAGIVPRSPSSTATRCARPAPVTPAPGEKTDGKESPGTITDELEEAIEEAVRHPRR
jgi:uncharacterized protein (UPF0218 family)